MIRGTGVICASTTTSSTLQDDDDDNDNDNDHNHETTLAIADSVRSGTEGSDWSASRGTSPVNSDADVVYEVQNSDDDVVLEKPAESAQAELGTQLTRYYNI